MIPTRFCINPRRNDKSEIIATNDIDFRAKLLSKIHGVAISIYEVALSFGGAILLFCIFLDALIVLMYVQTTIKIFSLKILAYICQKANFFALYQNR